MKLFLTLSGLVAAAYAKVALLVPFYTYPLNGGVADWDALIHAIDLHPDLDFYVIVNDINGPPFQETLPSSTLPSNIKDWAVRVGELNARSNAKTVGYIFTEFGKRDYATVEQGIDAYADWKTAEGWDGKTHDIHIDGIFFDEIDTNPAQLQRNLNMTRYARTTFSAKGGPIILNPGVAVVPGSEQLFDAADSILSLETCYTKDYGVAKDNGVARCPKGYTPFTPASLDSLPNNKTRVAKSSVVIHDFYETWNPYQPASQCTLEADVTAIIEKKVHSFYIAQHGYLGNFTYSPASVSEVAKLAASRQGLARR